MSKEIEQKVTKMIDSILLKYDDPHAEILDYVESCADTFDTLVLYNERMGIESDTQSIRLKNLDFEYTYSLAYAYKATNGKIQKLKDYIEDQTLGHAALEKLLSNDLVEFDRELKSELIGCIKPESAYLYLVNISNIIDIKSSFELSKDSLFSLIPKTVEYLSSSSQRIDAYNADKIIYVINRLLATTSNISQFHIIDAAFALTLEEQGFMGGCIGLHYIRDLREYLTDSIDLSKADKYIQAASILGTKFDYAMWKAQFSGEPDIAEHITFEIG